MHTRLMRSRTEVIIAGVCGGLGEYFGVDPVIVRLIFVLVTLTTGLGIVIYPILWLVMPKAGTPPHGQPRAGTLPEQEQAQQTGYVFQEARARQPVSQSRVAGPAGYTEEPPPPGAYQFDPLTGQPIQQPAATGQTIQLPQDPAPAPVQSRQQPYAPASRPRRGRWLAFALIGLGALILADTLGFDTDMLFPILMIGAGILLLRRK